jgi:hypothetical protein
MDCGGAGRIFGRVLQLFRDAYGEINFLREEHNIFKPSRGGERIGHLPSAIFAGVALRLGLSKQPSEGTRSGPKSLPAILRPQQTQRLKGPIA